MKLQGKTKADRALEIEARKVDREKRRRRARDRERWEQLRSKWRTEGRKIFGSEEDRQRAAAAIRAFMANGADLGQDRPPERVRARNRRARDPD